MLSSSFSRVHTYSSSTPQLAPVRQDNAGVTTVNGAVTSSVESMSEPPYGSSISSWTAPRFFTDLSAFNVTHFASGKDNLDVVLGVTPDLEDRGHADDSSISTSWTNSSTMLQLFYPKDSINPAGWPKGGSEFYAAPLDVRKARNVTLEYKVFFPSDFDFVKGGKLPGLYGGHMRCSGGDPALDCFSTRLMWRAGGAGELYLYAPKDLQTASLCSAPPQSVCDQTYGLSIARGSFAFSRGAWTHIRQTVILNTPGLPNGGFILTIDGKHVINRTDVLYREKPREIFVPAPAHGPNSAPHDGSGVLDSLLDGLVGSVLGLKVDGTQESSSRNPLDYSTGFVTSVQDDKADANTHTDSLVRQEFLEGIGDMSADASPLAGTTQRTDEPIGFEGVFFRHVPLG
ncbi:hypothetical protein F5148DRAFT_982769 [Russula earlei]|uniref:Uncharacterized protein n=1 Tax=Russula earlei TaxID=71964 RepID=A0ACC0U530_9AGAM|nr:hypothetical protein F5148DRAFT_982769 [Russula earlei]